MVAINPWFDRIILCVIFANCFFLAIDKEISSVTAVANEIDLVFLIIYTVEMILKIIAMGFFMRAHSYLRDPWNVVSIILTNLIFIIIFPSLVGLPCCGARLGQSRPLGAGHFGHSCNQNPEAAEDDQLDAWYELPRIHNIEQFAHHGRHYDPFLLHARHVRHYCHLTARWPLGEALLRKSG